MTARIRTTAESGPTGNLPEDLESEGTEVAGEEGGTGGKGGGEELIFGGATGGGGGGGGGGGSAIPEISIHYI